MYFPDTISMLPFPNQQHCSNLIGLAIRCNWLPITFHSKLIFISVPTQKKGNADCQSRHTNMPGQFLKENCIHWQSNLSKRGVYMKSPSAGKLTLLQGCLGSDAANKHAYISQQVLIDYALLPGNMLLHSMRKHFLTIMGGLYFLMEEINAYLLWSALMVCIFI